MPHHDCRSPRWRRRLRAIALLPLFFASVARGDEPLDRFIYPLAQVDGQRTPTFELDLSEVNDDEQAVAWGKRANSLCEGWFPIGRRLLATEDWTPPESIRLAIKKNMQAPAATSGAKISVSADWIAKHPDDFGCVIHELTHVIQDYPPGRPGWVVEGIADYIRYWKYEPEKPHGRVRDRASYRDGYSTSGDFLAWLVWKYDRTIVHQLDAAMRKKEDAEPVLLKVTGKDVDTLWKEYVESKGR